MSTYDDPTPNPFSDDPDPSPSASARSPSRTPSPAPAAPAYDYTRDQPNSGGFNDGEEDTPYTPFSNPSSNNTPGNEHSSSPMAKTGSHGGSQISAASGSPPPTHRASFPNPSAAARAYHGSMQKQGHGHAGKEGPCCERDAELQRGAEISIIDAHKTSDGGKGSYITYVIRTGNHETRRRYSAFDSLRTSLLRLYPVLIIPPIPSKQSPLDFAVKGAGKAKEDATVIARRIRMLEDFLRRVGGHPILSGEHVFHRFLEEGVSWNEVLHSPPLSLLPKNPLHAPSHNPTMQSAPGSASTNSQTYHPQQSEGSETSDADAADRDDGATISGTPSNPTTTVPYIAHHLLPTPSASHPLKQPDSRFLDSEAFTDKFAQHLSGNMEKVNRRVVKRWGDRATGASELGALLNSFSLESEGTLGIALEKFGQAVDAEHLSTALLLQQWEQSTTEPLHVYSQYGQIIKQRLAFRHQKHVQHEMVQEALEHQREKLEILERAEAEARRLEEALESGGRNLSASALGESRRDLGGDGMSGSASTARPLSTTSRKGAGGTGLLSAVKHSLSGMMDVDPEATRRANIGRTRDNISQLEDSLQASAQDLKYASSTLQADLDRFQRQKVADLRDMAISLAEIHRDWAKHNLKAWEAAQEAIRAVEPHPNHPPSGSAAATNSPSKPFAEPRGAGGSTGYPAIDPYPAVSISPPRGALKRSDTATTVTSFPATSSPVLGPSGGHTSGSFEVKRGGQVAPTKSSATEEEEQSSWQDQGEVKTYEGGPL